VVSDNLKIVTYPFRVLLILLFRYAEVNPVSAMWRFAQFVDLRWSLDGPLVLRCGPAKKLSKPRSEMKMGAPRGCGVAPTPVRRAYPGAFYAGGP